MIILSFKKNVCCVYVCVHVMYYGIIVDLQSINFSYAFSSDRHALYNITIENDTITKHDNTKDTKQTK